MLAIKANKSIGLSPLLSVALLIGGCGSGAPPRWQPTSHGDGEDPLVRVPVEVERVTQFTGTPLSVCSFNNSFVGQWPHKQDRDLAKLLSRCHIVLVQELVAPPTAIAFEDDLDGDGEADRVDRNPASPPGEDAIDRSKRMFDAFEEEGFAYHLSEDDTGRVARRQRGTGTEWFVAFYRPQLVRILEESTGFIVDTLVRDSNGDKRGHGDGNGTFDRVPYAFAFETMRDSGLWAKDDHLDFVLISVHLHSNRQEDRQTDTEIRAQEFREIGQWIKQRKRANKERDYLIVGDTNIENAAEYELWTDPTYNVAQLTSLNHECHGTSVASDEGKPLDHVFYSRRYSKEVIPKMEILDLAALFDYENFPGGKAKFKGHYSDHNPIRFFLSVGQDDDGTPP